MSEKQVRFILSVLEGAQKGKSFELSTDQIKIGREPDNEISLDDPRTSRHHALITIEEDIIKIRDLDSQNGVFVNGQRIKKAKVKVGNKIVIGNTTFELKENVKINSELSHVLEVNTPSVSHLPPIEKKGSLTLTSQTQFTKLSEESKTKFETGFSTPPISPTPQVSVHVPPIHISKASQQNSNHKKGPNLLIPFVLAILVIGYIFLQKENSKNKNSNYGIRTEDDIQREISSAEERTNELIRIKTNEGHFSRQHEEAHAAYIQGFRDYREGYYQRAIQQFTAALALNPGHVLAQKYKKQSELKLDELIQTSLREGKRHFEQNRFELAKSSFKRILVLINDPNNKIYQEAYQRVQEIELILRGKY